MMSGSGGVVVLISLMTSGVYDVLSMVISALPPAAMILPFDYLLSIP